MSNLENIIILDSSPKSSVKQWVIYSSFQLGRQHLGIRQKEEVYRCLNEIQATALPGGRRQKKKVDELCSIQLKIAVTPVFCLIKITNVHQSNKIAI